MQFERGSLSWIRSSLSGPEWLCAFHAADYSAPLHKKTNGDDDDRDQYCDLNYIRQCQVLHLPGLFRQFNSVGVFLVALALFGKDLLEPLCLFFGNPPIH